LGVELDLKEFELSELKQRRNFCELQYNYLGEQHLVLVKKGVGSSMHPHPNCNLKVKSNIAPSFLKIVPCVVCLYEFPHNDIVTFVCKHFYHPWCALMHFKHSNKCADPHCKTYMSLEWFKSFGFK